MGYHVTERKIPTTAISAPTQIWVQKYFGSILVKDSRTPAPATGPLLHQKGTPFFLLILTHFTTSLHIKKNFSVF